MSEKDDIPVVTMTVIVLCIVCWDTVLKPFRRLFRWVSHRCIVCGRSIGVAYDIRRSYGWKRPLWRYCSMECAAYDGALRDPKKSWVLFGTIKEPKRHYEADMVDA